MKRYWIFWIFIHFTFILQAQSFQTTEYGATLKDAEELDKVCPPPLDEDGLGFNTNRITQKTAKKIVNKILFDLGIENQYKLRECKERSKGNAKAVMLRRGNKFEQYILYDVDFLNEMANKMSDPGSQAPAAATFVLAHEVGHHIKNHTLNYSRSNPEIEMEADEYAAFTMAKIGYSLSDVLETPRTEKNLVTKFFYEHPGKMDRMKAAFTGWMKYAENDSLLKRANATNIYNYHKEIEGYQNLVREQRQKAQDDKEVAKQEVNTKDKEPEASVEELEEKKEQDEANVILQKYFKALGGMAKVNSIKTMSFQELTQEGNYDKFDYHYDHQSPTLLVVTNFTPSYEGEQYKISNDSLYYRFKSNDLWRSGIPKGEDKDPQEFKNRISSSTGNFLEDFKLFSSPNLVALKEKVNFEGELCYRLEVKEVLEDTYFDKRGTGEKVYMKQNRYYRVSDGLLHATENIRKTQYFKKNKPDGREKEITVTVHKDYQEVEGLQFPMNYKIVTSYFEGSNEIVEQIITKKVSDVEVSFENKNL
ncbi:MAG: hypothetical protein AAF039_04740 [Bacteroidota bacterium]